MSSKLHLPRRQMLALPLALAFPLGACAAKQAPLAHLHGQAWVSGAYELYGKSYLDVQTTSESLSMEAYRMIAQRGVSALDGLQSREVPFRIKVDESDKGFAVLRDVPDVLMFRADMTEADRKAAQAAWDKAREHIQTDYMETRRLDWSLTRLLTQLQKVRSAIDHSYDEQYGLTRQIGELEAGKLPFELPQQVTAKDYAEVLTMLIDRLDDDRERLKATEATILAVGLACRATDEGSASLSANIRKVLLTVVADVTAPRAIDFPTDAGKRAEILERGKKRRAEILLSPEYQKFLTRDRDRALEQIGMLLSIVDFATGVPTSRFYKLAVDLWKGEKDYLEYVKTLVGMAPGGRALSKALEQAVALTDVARKVVGGGSKKEVAGALLNTATQFSRGRLHKQLAFFKDKAEARSTDEALKATDLMKSPPPLVPELR